MYRIKVTNGMDIKYVYFHDIYLLQFGLTENKNKAECFSVKQAIKVKKFVQDMIEFTNNPYHENATLTIERV